MALQYNVIVRKKDNGYQYIVSYKDSNGKWKQKSKQGFELSRKGKEKAKEAADSAVKQLKEIFDLNNLQDNEETTFKEYSESFIEFIGLYRAYHTCKSYKVALNQFSLLDNKNIKDINSKDIQDCINLLVLKGRSETTIKQYLVLLKATFRDMKKHNLIPDIPFGNLVVPDRKESSTKKALTPSQYNDLLSRLKNTKYYIIALLAGSCGLRIGEILGLTWDDFDVKKKILKVNRQWKLISKNNYGFGTLKSKNSYREVPMSNSVIKHLSELKMAGLTDKNNRILIERSTQEMSENLSFVLQAMEFDITVHELRHTFITNLIADGLDFKTVAKIAGDDVVQIMKTYAHVTDDMMKVAARKIENLYR